MIQNPSISYWILLFYVGLFLPSESFAVFATNGIRGHGPAATFWKSSSSRRGSLLSLQNTLKPENTYTETKPASPKRSNQIRVSAETELPFPQSIAFDAFADLPRQPSWAHWLSSVEFVGDHGETKWKMKFMGLSYSWRAISTQLDRPNLIEWKSTSGLKNYGRVELEPLKDESCSMKITMTFHVPRLLSRLVGNEDGAVARLVQNRMLRPMLTNFREVVLREDAKQKLIDNN